MNISKDYKKTILDNHFQAFLQTQNLPITKRLYIKQTFYYLPYIVLNWELSSHDKQQDC